MKNFKSFLILVMVVIFLSGCVENNSGVSPVERKEEHEQPELLVADMGDDYQIALPSSLVRWAYDTKKEKGVHFGTNGSTTWAWEKHLKYVISLIEDTKGIYQKRYGKTRERVYLNDTHFGLLKNRFRNLLTIKEIERVYYNKTTREKGLFMNSIPCRIITSTIEDPGIWKGLSRMKTVFFINKKGRWCILVLTNVDGQNPADLWGIINESSKLGPGNISQNFKSTDVIVAVK